MSDELFRVFRLIEQCRKQTPPEGRRIFLVLFSLINSIFDYSIIRFSERASERFPAEKRTVEYLSISDGLMGVFREYFVMGVFRHSPAPYGIEHFHACGGLFAVQNPLMRVQFEFFRACGSYFR